VDLGAWPRLPAKHQKQWNRFMLKELYFTAVILLEAQGPRTKYTAIVIHCDEATAKKHEEMGFYQGWGTTLDQLVALAKDDVISRQPVLRPDL